VPASPARRAVLARRPAVLARPRAVVRLLAALALVLMTAALGPVPAAGASTPDPGSQVSWSVSPAGPAGPDGRRTIDVALPPGGSVQEHVLVRNLGDHAVTFDLTANDGYLTASGRFDMRPRAHVPTEAGAWVEVVSTLELQAGDSAVVPVLLEVPADATPGDYSAGVAASVVTSADGLVSTEHRVGVRVDVRVAGDLAPALSLDDLEAHYVQSWNPFAPGAVTVSSTVANTGNVRLRSEVSSSVSPWSGRALTVATEAPDLSPGAQAPVVVTTERVWPLGPLRTTVALHPTADTEAAAGADAVAPVVQTVTTWALPAPQLVAALGALAVVLALRSAVRGRRRRLALMLAEAKRSGIAEATGRHGDPRDARETRDARDARDA